MSGAGRCVRVPPRAHRIPTATTLLAKNTKMASANNPMSTASMEVAPREWSTFRRAAITPSSGNGECRPPDAAWAGLTGGSRGTGLASGSGIARRCDD